jgi:thioredoxin-related protein
LLGWYCYKLTNKLLFISDNIEELYTRLQEFDEHIKFIYELEMYYGDETLKNLIRHSRDLRNYMLKYKDAIELAAEEENDDRTEQTEEDETETDDSEEGQEKFISAAGKTVFYQGT